MGNKKQTTSSMIYIRFSFYIFFFLLVPLLLCPTHLQAKSINKGQAEKIVRGWLKHNPEPMGMGIGQQINNTLVYTDANGEAIYYIVYLKPEGFVVVPADDEVEPIIAIVAHGIYNSSDNNPLGALVNKDVPSRISAVRELRKAGKANLQKKHFNKQQHLLLKSRSNARRKWAKLESYDNNLITTESSEISDVRVTPLIQTKWSQGGLYIFTGGEPVYFPIFNYYTPGPYYPCGCVATAMAQLMRYHEFPILGVGTPSFQIYVDGAPQSASLRGGDGSGGPYHWSDMVFEPDTSTPEHQRQAISALCYDAGVAVNMSYTEAGSGAGMREIDGALTGTFDYSTAIFGCDETDDLSAEIIGMLNPNLDANLPAILSIASSTTASFHAVVCDGYGYDNSTLYHHLNIGWGGNYDAWYALPEVGTYYEYDRLIDCVYNIFTTGSGEIISGRVTDTVGVPINNVFVTAHINGGSTYWTTTNEKGIYAFQNVPSKTTFCITACKYGWQFGTQIVTNGISMNDSHDTGNIWGVNFSGTNSAGFIEFEKKIYTAPETITIRVIDVDLQGNGTQAILLKVCNGDEETVMLNEYPVGSGIFTGDIPTVEGVVSTEDGIIQVLDCQMLIAVYEDSNDGTGSPIIRRDTATIANEKTIIYQTDFTGGLPAGWVIVNGYLDNNTWTSQNPGGQTSPYWTGDFMIIDCENPFIIGFDEELITQSIDCSVYEGITLTFGHDFRYYYDEVGRVDIRVNGGDWQNLTHYQAGDFAGIEEIDPIPIAAGQSNVQFRWHFFTSLLGEYWGIDNVKISGIPKTTAIPGDLEPDCDVDWMDLAMLSQEWLGFGLNSGDIAPSPTGDGIVNMLDFALLAEHWLEGIE